MPNTIHQLYGDYWGTEDEQVQTLLGTSLNPRDMDVLYDYFSLTKCGAGDLVLDIGCRDARYAIEISRRHGCRTVGIDPVERNIELANELITREKMSYLVSVRQGSIEDLPFEDESIDHIWCRDVLNHVQLEPGLQECARVLKPGGWMLVYQTFAGDDLEPKEAERIYAALSIVPENMSPAAFEAIATDAGLRPEFRDVIASEWRERWIEDGDTGAAQDFLEIARMRRGERELVEQIGRERYEAELAVRLWGVYQLLGKLMPAVYLLRKPPAPDPGVSG
jgi:SAM-dependent methyltransferase